MRSPQVAEPQNVSGIDNLRMLDVIAGADLLRAIRSKAFAGPLFPPSGSVAFRKECLVPNPIWLAGVAAGANPRAKL